MIRLRRFRSIILCTALVLGLLGSLGGGLLRPSSAHAESAGTLTWADYNTIDVTGPMMQQTGVLTSGSSSSLPTVPVSFTGTLSFKNPTCSMFVTLRYDPSRGDVGTFTNLNSVSGKPFCDSSRQAVYQNQSIFINPGNRPGPGSAGGGGSRAQTVTIRLESSMTSDASPATINVEIHDAGGVLDSVSASKQIVGGDATYEAKFTLQPGDYTACADNTSVYNCSGFTPGDYSPAQCSGTDANSVLLRAACSNFSVPSGKGNPGTGGTYQFGFPHSDSGVNVTVNFHLSGSGRSDQSFGPVQVALQKADGTVVDTISTTSWSYKGNPLVAAGSTQLFSDSVTGSFANVPVGTYKACIVGTSFCDDNVQKFTDAPGNAVINLDESQTGQLAGSLGSDEAPPCERNGDVLTWALCPIFNGLTNLSDAILNNIIQPLLQNNLVGLGANDSDYKIWSAFRIYGDIFLIIALIVVVIGQSVGGGLLEAYTVRKVLPRILLSTILINLSIYIVAFAVDIANIVGAGMANLIISPVKASAEFTFTPNGIQAAGLVIGGAALTAGIISAFLTKALFSGVAINGALELGYFVILPALLALAGAFITIILLKGLILALIVVSPVAFALYCLPNTEQYFRRWWEWLFRALLVYPIVMFLFAIADLMTVMIQQGNGLCNQDTASKGCPPLFEYTIGAGTNVFAVVVAFFVQFLPLVLIPFAFRLAGGIVGKVHDTISGYGKKTHEAIGGNPNDPMSLRNRLRRNFMESLTRSQARIVDKGRDPNATRLQRARGRFSRTVWRGVDERLARQTKEARELEETMSTTGRDQLRYAAAGYKVAAGERAPDSVKANAAPVGHDRYFNSKGEEISGELYREAHTFYGGDAAIAQGLNYTARKIQTDEDIANFRESFSRVAAARNWSQTEANDAWAAATFEYKPQLGSEWYSKPQVQTDPSTGRTMGVKYRDIATDEGAYSGFISEQHKTKESYKLGSLRDSEYRAMGDKQADIQARLDRGEAVTDEELTNLAMTNETISTQVKQGMSMGSVQQDSDGNLMIGGVSPAAQGVLTAMYKNQKYETRAAKNADGSLSLNERVLYDRDAVKVERAAHEAGMRSGAIAPGTAFDEDSAIDRHTLRDAEGKARTVSVTGTVGREDVRRAGLGPTAPRTAPRRPDNTMPGT